MDRAPKRSQRQTLAQRVAADILQQIQSGALRIGDKLPSLREYMRLHDLSKNTVITAYEYLTAEGMIEARQGQGFFVSVQAPLRQAEIEPPPYDRARNTILMMRQQFVREPGQLHLGEGFPPIEWLSAMRLDKFNRQVVRSGVATLFRYGERLGNSHLRQQLVKKLAGYNISTTPSQIVTTYGANHAMDLIIRHFINPGDPVLVENPGYYPLFGKLQLQGARMLPVTRQTDGPDVDQLEQWLIKEKPSLFFLQSVAQNPTGTDLSLDKAQRILALARKYHVILVENDAMADFQLSSALKLSALDQLHNTLYIGSFSKSISAALRVGFIAGPEKLISDLADVKILLHTSGSEYGERMIDVILREGQYLRHLSRLQQRLRKATQRALDVLDAMGAEVFFRPEQSLYLWARFPGIEDAQQLADTYQKQGVMLAPGSIFSVDHSAPVPWTRLNVAYLEKLHSPDTLFPATRL